jgi:hypothetical protein
MHETQKAKLKTQKPQKAKGQKPRVVFALFEF